MYYSVFSKSTKFYKNPLETHDNMGLQPYKKLYAKGQALSPGIHFVVKIGKLGISYFYVFATDFNETFTDVLNWHYKLSNVIYFLLEWKKKLNGKV